MKFFSNKVLAIVPAGLLLVSGCDGPNDPAPKARTEISMENPETIGTLHDGRVVKHFTVDRGFKHDHHVYFVENPDGGGSTTTTNTVVSQGKTTVPLVTVEIDGVKYEPKKVDEKTNP